MPSWKKLIQSGSNAELNHITASGRISASGNILTDGTLSVQGNTAVGFHGGSNTLLFSGTGINTNIKGDSISFTSTEGFAPISGVGQITSSGTISASGELISVNTSTHRIDRIDNAKTGVAFGDGINVINNMHITASGNISASGTLSAQNITSGPAGGSEGGQITLLAQVGGSTNWNIDNYQDRMRIFKEDASGGGGAEYISVRNTGLVGFGNG